MAAQPWNQIIDLSSVPAEGMDESNVNPCTIPVASPYPAHLHFGPQFHDDHGHFAELRMSHSLHTAMAADQCMPFDHMLGFLSSSIDAKQISRRSWQDVLNSSPTPAHEELDVCRSGVQDEAGRPRPEREETYEQADNNMEGLINENGFLYLVMSSDADDGDYQQIISRSSTNAMQYAAHYERQLGWENHESAGHNLSIFGCTDAAEEMQLAAKGKRPYIQTGHESTVSVITAVNGHVADHNHHCTSGSREDSPNLIGRPNLSIRMNGSPVLSKKRPTDDDQNIDPVSTDTSLSKRIKIKHVEAGRSSTSQTSQTSTMSRSSCLPFGLTAISAHVDRIKATNTQTGLTANSAHDRIKSINTQTVIKEPDQHLSAVEAASSSSHHHHSSSRGLRSQPALNTDGKPRALLGSANDPQSIAARNRRERINARIKILQELVPNGSKVDLVTMLEKAINYVKFLQLQLRVLSNDGYWNSSDQRA